VNSHSPMFYLNVRVSVPNTSKNSDADSEHWHTDLDQRPDPPPFYVSRSGVLIIHIEFNTVGTVGMYCRYLRNPTGTYHVFFDLV